MSFIEWPELATVTKEQRFELVVKDAKGRNPPLSDEELQKTVFEKNPHLNFISISGSGLSHLSSSIVACVQLTKLVIIRNDLVSVPEEIGTLTKLTFVDLSNNHLESLPASFAKLSKMETFVASGNKLSNEGLFDFSSMHSLLVVDLSYNELTSVPKSLTGGQLVRLHTLNFAHNKIKEIFNKC
ncbi:unnamed protein product [Strongylus vulgaris]|uniref:Uncharacterized protein n=1 Tax=Strongylus vulgaris TaxID=40348 RepID=A0A3P7JR75_STRVU|nr:unnamed protein product [Strongylus vulgaris]